MRAPWIGRKLRRWRVRHDGPGVLGECMRRLVHLIALILIVSLSSAGPVFASPKQPTVKDVALAFGLAIEHDDGATALRLLAPDLRSHITASQLPGMLNVRQPPLGVHVIRWAYDNGRGDATLSLRYADHLVAEHLFMKLYAEGWRITAIVPEDPLVLQRGAETAVVAFCDGAIRGDPRTMRAQLTDKYAAKNRTDAQVRGLLGIPGPLLSYNVLNYFGGAAGADVVVKVRSDTRSVTDRFSVINDRDGWRITSITQENG